MKKAELIAAVAESTGQTKAAVKSTIDAVFQTISTSIQQRQDVTIPGFGTFTVRTRADRQGVDPATQMPTHIPGGTVGAFKPAKPLRNLST